MSMFSEITTEYEVKAYCKEIQRMLQEGADNGISPDAVRLLKELGRFSLTRFEWTTPEWAEEYRVLFQV